MTADEKARIIVEAVQRLTPGPARHLLAIAGPPAAGKSTVAELVCAKLNDASTPTGLVPMDGFHLENDELTENGLLPRKGAPNTFDLVCLTETLRRLTSEEDVAIPLFDRQQDRTLPAAARIEEHQRHIIVEGNYLLLDAEGWRDLRPLWSLSAFVGEDLHVLENRLIQRWLDHGLQLDDAMARAHSNDLPNAKTVLSKRLPADLELIG